MATQTPIEIVKVYIDLLIMQYLNKPNASGTIRTLASPAILPQTSAQTIGFDPVPSSGSFVLSYDGVNSAPIDWNDTQSAIEAILQAIPDLENISVVGDVSTGMTVTFDDVMPPAFMLEVVSSTLQDGPDETVITITETDVTLPIAVQDAFNLLGNNLAQGVQLNVLGMYAGVSRTGQGFNQQITLDDADFLSLITMAVVKNSAGSSLADIQFFLNEFFPNQIFVFDNQNMTMEFVISQTVGSQDLAQMLIVQGLLPIPMGVRATVIAYAPSANLFSFRTYLYPNTTGSGANTYDDYQLDRPWLTYKNVIL